VVEGISPEYTAILTSWKTKVYKNFLANTLNVNNILKGCE
jgi:hypothetical protein